MQCDEELVKDIFWEEDAEVILATPIREYFKDFHAWHYDNKGNFSVKSTYQVYARNRHNATEASTLEAIQEDIS